MIIERPNHGFTTLLEAINVVETEGYTVPFTIIHNKLTGVSGKVEYPKEQITSISYLRIAAPLSDPDEESILYLISLKNGMRGWISDSYSMYADTALSDFLKDYEKHGNNK